MTKNRFWNKRILLSVVVAIICINIHAIPAKRGIWNHITLSDGTQVTAELRGDEHGKFWVDRDGNAYVIDEQGAFVKMTIEEATATLAKERQLQEDKLTARFPKAPRKVIGIPTDKSIFQGQKKGIVILVQFPEGTYINNSDTINDPAVSFSEENPALLGCSTPQELYQKIINQRNLKDDPNRGPFTGSVKDYFIDQSFGQFELDFDVVGPYTLSKCHHYYGENNRSSDSHPGEMVYEAVLMAINDGVDFSQYDWNGDKKVDQIFVLYAGQGEADGGPSDCIWPHEYYLTYAYKAVTTTVNGKKITIDQYACSNELATNKRYGKTKSEEIVYGTQINGIGIMCHEFSHCIGYPDMYDIAYKNYGMSNWDLMDGGSYNGEWNGGHNDWVNLKAGYQPAGYTAFERWCAGWIEPIVLTEPQKITRMKPMGGTRSGGPNDHGEAYVIYMPGSTESIQGEYYMLENRQQENWDSSLPWHGLLITYVHYNQNLWRNNCLNCTDQATLAIRNTSNTHQRMSVFQAGGSDPGYLSLDAYPYKTDYLTELMSSWGSTGIEIINRLNNSYGSKGLSLSTEDCDELTSSTSPNAYYWGNDTTAQPLTGKDIWKIYATEDDEKSMSFIYQKLPTEMVLELDQNTDEVPTLEKGLYSSVTLNRQLNKDTYNTLWLPFDMNQEEIIANLGEGTEIYRLTDITPDEEGKFIINIAEDTRNGIKAFEPILVRLGEEAESSPLISINDYVQINDNFSDKEPIVELPNGWKFVGTKTNGYVPVDAKYLKDNKYYTAGKNKTVIKAYRAYFVAPDSEDIENNSAKEVVFNVINHEQHETDIKPTMVQPMKQGDIYDLAGRKVDANKLNKGIYLQNGKKFVVK